MLLAIVMEKALDHFHQVKMVVGGLGQDVVRLGGAGDVVDVAHVCLSWRCRAFNIQESRIDDNTYPGLFSYAQALRSAALPPASLR